MKSLNFHPLALQEMKAAHTWYSEHSIQAADGFYEELLPVFEGILRNPELYPRYLFATQRVVLKRYPFLVIYRELLEQVQIIAVVHAKRRPGYWAKRLKQ